MDRIETLRLALNTVVRQVGDYLGQGRNRGVETLVVIDAEHDRYGLFRVGWQSGTNQRIANTVFLARIKDGKVWIEEDNTDLTLADELLKAGVSKDDIVLAFHPPEIRRLGEFAVA